MDKLIRWFGVLSAMCLANMTLVLAATLVLRPFGILVPSGEEIVTFSMVAMAFFGFVYAYLEGAHVRVDTLFSRLPRALQKTLEIASHFGAAALCAGVTFYSAQLAFTAYRFNDVSDGLVPIPMFVPMGVVPLGFGLFALVLLRDGVRVLSGANVLFALTEKEEAISLATAAMTDEAR
jgi:TRAP-type C4-dicarboxylate transport system permease small subunit